jgi:hypothetical protein
MGHGSPTTHKDVCDIDLACWCIQGCGSSTTWPKVLHLGLYNMMPKIQAIKNIFLIPITPSLKNVTSSLAHEKEKKK